MEAAELNSQKEQPAQDIRLVVDTIPTLVWSASPDGSADFFNQPWLEYTGLSVGQALGWGWKVAIHPDDLPRLMGIFQEGLQIGQPFEVEGRFRRADGEFRWFLFRGNPLLDESGKVAKWYGTNTDIEYRKRGEEALHARELSWRQIVDNIPGLVCTTSASGEVEYLNRQLLEYFGKTPNELKNWPTSDAVHPDDLPHVLAVFKHSIKTGDLEHRCRRADGVYRWFQVRALPVKKPEGRTRGWYILLTDIDDRKRAEGRTTWKGDLAVFLFLWHCSERLYTYRQPAVQKGNPYV